MIVMMIFQSTQRLSSLLWRAFEFAVGNRGLLIKRLSWSFAAGVCIAYSTPLYLPTLPFCLQAGTDSTKIIPRHLIGFLTLWGQKSVECSTPARSVEDCREGVSQWCFHSSVQCTAASTTIATAVSTKGFLFFLFKDFILLLKISYFNAIYPDYISLLISS